MTKLRGTVRKLGLEGGLWALVTDSGDSIELIDPPEALQQDGVRAEVVADRSKADVTVGMVGDAVHVASYEIL
ncbi:MAG: hypothetical protein ACOCUS_02065 [Polyangiales bacterium]